MSLDEERLAGLARTKLEGLVRRAFPDVEGAASTFNAGVAIHSGERAFLYLTGSGPSPLGAALAWGATRGATELHVIADDPDPTMVTQTEGLYPRPSIWRAAGPDLVPAATETTTTAARAEPPDQAKAMIPTLTAAGCDVVIEHGVIVGEVLGLEVARVVTDASGAAEIRVGVGLYDQEAHALMNAAATVDERLSSVIEEVLMHRRAEAGPHPLNRVARERWLRALVLADPGQLGLDAAEPLEPLSPRGGIHEGRPAALLGTSDGRSVIVVASTGIDLDLVPHAAGHIASTEATEVVLVLPERDHHDVIRRQAQRLALPFELTSLPDPWPN
jgi:hypothetical protein